MLHLKIYLANISNDLRKFPGHRPVMLVVTLFLNL